MAGMRGTVFRVFVISCDKAEKWFMLLSHNHKKSFKKKLWDLPRSDDDNRKPWGLSKEFLRHIPHDVFLIMEVSQSSHPHRRWWGETQLFSLTNTTMSFRKNFFHSSFKRIFRWIDKRNFFSFIFPSKFRFEDFSKKKKGFSGNSKNNFPFHRSYF